MFGIKCLNVFNLPVYRFNAVCGEKIVCLAERTAAPESSVYRVDLGGLTSVSDDVDYSKMLLFSVHKPPIE